MKNIIFVFGMLIISTAICFAQEEEEKEPILVPAWDIFITCTDAPPDHCPQNSIKVYAYATVNGELISREMYAVRRPDGIYFVVFNMSGMPARHPDNTPVIYTIMVSPCGSQKMLPYPAGSVAVYMAGSPRPR